MTVTLDRNVEDFIGAPRQLFIDGQWAERRRARRSSTPNPATGEMLAQVAEGDAEDIDRAVAAARRAFEDGPWSRMTAVRTRPDHLADRRPDLGAHRRARPAGVAG